MNAPPLTRAQLVGLPFWGGIIGIMLAGFFAKLLGRHGTIALALVLGVTMAALGGWIAYRSDFAARHGLVGAVLMLLLLTPLLAGSAVMTVSLAGASELTGLAIVTSMLTIALAFGLAMGLQWRRLAAEGNDGPWARTNVDPDAGRMRASALVRAPDDASPWSPWLVAALAANGPLIYRSWGFGDAQFMPAVLAVLAATSVWICVGFVGPMAGKACFLLRLERHTQRRLVHEHYEELQALRHDFWLSRLLMSHTDPDANTR